jgi:hypothetical protein
MGKEKALEAMTVYTKMAQERGDTPFRFDLDEQRVFLILRVLFQRVDGQPEMPWVGIGATSPEVKDGNRDWPLFPLTMQNDIPFCLASGYSLAGQAESPMTHIEYCRRNCHLRWKPLQPTSSPVQAVETLFQSAQWKRLFPEREADAMTRSLLRAQALQSAQSFIKTDFSEFNPNCVGWKEADKTWAKHLEIPGVRTMHWDATTSRFVGGQ